MQLKIGYLFQCLPRASPWVIMNATLSPCKGKSFKRSRQHIKLLPLQGALLTACVPRALPWARSFCPFRACCSNLASAFPLRRDRWLRASSLRTYHKVQSSKFKVQCKKRIVSTLSKNDGLIRCAIYNMAGNLGQHPGDRKRKSPRLQNRYRSEIWGKSRKNIPLRHFRRMRQMEFGGKQKGANLSECPSLSVLFG